MLQQQVEQTRWDVDYLRVEGEGLREPEGVRVVFVIISKLLTLYKKGFELKSAS